MVKMPHAALSSLCVDACRVIFWVQHGALTEERAAGGGVQYRRASTPPDAFAATGGEALVDTEDDDAAPVAAARVAAPHSCEQFLPVRNPFALCRLHKSVLSMHRAVLLCCHACDVASTGDAMSDAEGNDAVAVPAAQVQAHTTAKSS